MEEIYNKITNPDEWGIDNNETSEIQKFYANQSVFLTGCTGFLGKCIVEKLLRSCPDLKKIYLLVRPKKISAQERIKEYFNNVLFDELKKLQPKFTSKIVVIKGNLESENLGLSDEDKCVIINEATIFIHNASNVKFDLRISDSLSCNVFGTKNMLDLACQCKYIKVFTYVSTAYSNCHEKQIFEKCYPSPGDLNLIQNCIDTDRSTPDGMSSTAIKDFISPWENMYVFGKATAENLVKKYAEKSTFRCTIFRPSIIMSSFQEPIPGWTGNLNGPVIMFLGSGLGLVHVAYQMTNPFDMVPVDMCTNGLIATTWDAVVNQNETGKVFVYNYASSVVNPVSIKKFEKMAYERGCTAPAIKSAPHFFHITNSVVLFLIGHILGHCIPAIFADIVLLASGKKPFCVSIVYKATLWLPTVCLFANGNWRIYVNETTKVWDRMNKRDNELFYNDLRSFDWNTYCYYYWAGLRLYIMKDSISTVKDAKKKFDLYKNILHILFYIILLLFVYISWDYIVIMFKPFLELIKLVNSFI